jgi:hypothetical protein
MQKTCSAVVLLSVLLATAASAQTYPNCNAVGQQLASAYQQWQSALSVNSGAATEYSTCVQNQSRPESQQAREQCKDKYSKLQSAKQDLEAAISEYENWRQSDCVQQQPANTFGRIRPQGLWPPAR